MIEAMLAGIQPDDLRDIILDIATEAPDVVVSRIVKAMTPIASTQLASTASASHLDQPISSIRPSRRGKEPLRHAWARRQVEGES